jgi:hypothetical protein
MARPAASATPRTTAATRRLFFLATTDHASQILMSRILLQLSIANILALTLTYILGWISFARGAYLIDGMNYPLHFYLGLFTVFGNLGLHCLVFIYFLGTGRWVKEVALAYGMPDEPLPKLTRELKRRTFPPALFAMLIPIAAAAAGMAQYRRGEWPWYVHATLATLSLLVNLWACRIEYRNVTINAGVIAGVMQEVERIRSQRGLPTNEEAWRQQA